MELMEAPIEAEVVEARRKPGRPVKVTMELVEQIARLIAKGMTEEQACIRVGVNHSSFRTARHRDEEFETAVKRAQAEYVDESIDIISKGEKGWQARAWLLERRHGRQFSRLPDTVVNVSQQVALTERDLDEMSDDELQMVIIEKDYGLTHEQQQRLTPEQRAALVEVRMKAYEKGFAGGNAQPIPDSIPREPQGSSWNGQSSITSPPEFRGSVVD